MTKLVIVIPAFNPDVALLEVISGVLPLCQSLIVVNDGSDSPGSCGVLDELRAKEFVHVLDHKVNRGKGAALKTAFNYCLRNLDFSHVLTVDADGQHTPFDVAKLVIFVKSNPMCNFVIAQRNFSCGVPLRSKLGNLLTSYIFSRVYGVDFGDTQNGLRALSREVVISVRTLDGSGYDFESEVLVWVVRKRIGFSTVDVSTTYIDGNSSSHFRPVSDSVRIYRSILGFGFSSVFCFAIDFLLFSVLFFFTGLPAFSVILSRFFSGIINFNINHHIFLGVRDNRRLYFVRYCFLFFLIMAISVFGVELSIRNDFDPYFSKILIDSFLFFVSFSAQKKIFS